MTNETIRDHCLSLPHVTEVVQWGGHLLFKVGGKMFAIIDLDGHSCSLKCSPDDYAELVETEDIVPASHNMWKYNWVTCQTLSALPDARFRELLGKAYRLVRAGLPKKAREELDALDAASVSPRPTRPPRAKPAAAAKRAVKRTKG